MSDLGDILGFEAFNLKEIGRKIKDNPARLLYGGIDPASTKVWNKVLGKDDKPLVDQFGGASADTFGKAEGAGIDTKAGHNMHRLARVVASMYALGYGANQMGAGGSTGTSGGGEAGQGFDFANMPSLPSNSQQQQEPPVKPLEVEFDAEGQPMVVSSKSKKQPGARTPVGELVRRGLAGENVIDAIGVRTGLIKEAGMELDDIESQLDKLLAGDKR